MASPLVIPTPSSLLSTVRYYGPLDPYYYTVDNRPLSDLDQNVQGVLTSPIDALFRASAINSNNSPLAVGAVVNPSVAGTITGMAVYNPAPGSITIGQGALFVRDNISTSTAVSVVKMFSLISPQSLSCPVPGTAGQSVNYLIQGAIDYFDASTMATSSFPFLSAGNTELPGLLPNGEIRVSAIAGTAAATGSQTTPSPTGGAFPLYVVTVSNAGTVYVAAAPNAPYMDGLNAQAVISASSVNPATTTSICGSVQYFLTNSVTMNVNLQFPITGQRINPFMPIKLRLAVAPTVGGGAVTIATSYLAVGQGDPVNATATTVSEDVPLSSTANACNIYTLNAATIPSSVFAGFNGSGQWVVNKQRLFVEIGRVGANGSDTNTGDLTLIDAVAYQ